MHNYIRFHPGCGPLSRVLSFPKTPSSKFRHSYFPYFPLTRIKADTVLTFSPPLPTSESFWVDPPSPSSFHQNPALISLKRVPPYSNDFLLSFFNPQISLRFDKIANFLARGSGEFPSSIASSFCGLASLLACLVRLARLFGFFFP